MPNGTTIAVHCWITRENKQMTRAPYPHPILCRCNLTKIWSSESHLHKKIWRTQVERQNTGYTIPHIKSAQQQTGLADGAVLGFRRLHRTVSFITGVVSSPDATPPKEPLRVIKKENPTQLFPGSSFLISYEPIPGVMPILAVNRT